jgi:hypothetical protein
MHKLMFFRTAATPQMVVSMGPNVTRRTCSSSSRRWTTPLRLAERLQDAVPRRRRRRDGGRQGPAQLDFKATQGAGETRIAAAAGVHPVIAGLSEGLAGSSLNAGQLLVGGAARRPTGPCARCGGTWPGRWRTSSRADRRRPQSSGTTTGTSRSCRRTARTRPRSSSRRRPRSGRWSTRSSTPDSVVAAVAAQDMTLLKHTGIPTVQGQQAATGRRRSSRCNGSGNGTTPPRR